MSMLLSYWIIGIAEATSCYLPSTPLTPYNVLEIAKVETQRGCEVLCDAQTTCAGFSFKDSTFSSSCVLLSTSIPNANCAIPTEIMLKTITGCVARTNITAEFGVDPCIDEMAPMVLQIGKPGPICPISNGKVYIIRAIDETGRRHTFDNDIMSWMEKSGDMWLYRFDMNPYPQTVIPIIAATCAIAGGVKCPCAP
ncbi:hypothetical protein PENTCL1PPCAC_973, partial [Pristionchus entomophagus]